MTLHSRPWPIPPRTPPWPSSARRIYACSRHRCTKLDLDQRTVFMLFEIEKLTGDEIAEALEIPLGTVYSRLRLARKAFSRIVVQQARLRDSTARAGNR